VAGLTDEGLDALGAVAARHVDDGDVPGVVALVARGDQVHVEVRGRLAVDGPPLARDSLFRIASVTKPITAAATMALVAEGRVELDEPVDRLLPELADRRVLRRLDSGLDDTVPARRAVTVRDLLTFTFGFGVVFELFGHDPPLPIVRAEADARLHTLGPPDPTDQPPTDEWLARLGALPLLAQPGERWLYNTSASVLSILCARAGGGSFDEVLASRVLAPVGMGDTAFWTEETARLATAYQRRDGALAVWDPPAGTWSRPPPFPDGAAGLVSTADDLLAFGRLLLRAGNGVLEPSLVRAMTTNQLSDEQRRAEGGGILRGLGWGFCQAVRTEGDHAGAFGWDGGFGTTWLVDPARDLVVVVLTQVLFTSPVPPPTLADLVDAAYAAVA
jgi:CubicO group peptidase (beta-lactamase class C family)